MHKSGKTRSDSVNSEVTSIIELDNFLPDSVDREPMPAPNAMTMGDQRSHTSANASEENDQVHEADFMMRETDVK